MSQVSPTLSASGGPPRGRSPAKEGLARAGAGANAPHSPPHAKNLRHPQALMAMGRT